MRVRVLLFGPEEERVGRSSVDIEVGDAPTVSDVHRALCERWPEMKRGRLAVNHSFAPCERTINASDEVALIGLVSGG